MSPRLVVVAVAACSATNSHVELLPDAAIDPTSESLACPDYNPLKNPYFGDLHAHTSYSFDAYTFDTRSTPMDAYAFAKGAPITIAGAVPGGPTTQLDRPLDFLALTDHSEFLAGNYGCASGVDGTPYDPDSPYYNSTTCQRVRSTNPTIQSYVFLNNNNLQAGLCGSSVPSQSTTCAPVIAEAWSSVINAAASALDRCHFTSFVGYEWTNNCTASGGTAATCHKNVIFGDTNLPVMPFDSLTYPLQEQLWTALDTGCNGGPCNAITIPHNSNKSEGQAFSVPQGSESHAQKYQRLVEIFQHKGGSECFYDPNNPVDPTCNFEYLGGASETNLATSYVRTGLETGLTDQKTLHINPLQMGVVGGTDDHNGVPGNTREDTWPGHAGRLDDTPALRIPSGKSETIGLNPGGVAVAWAEQNTRAALFAAFQRRETYATSGPRIIVRMYQTWDKTTDFCADPNFPSQLVQAGALPMGSSITVPSGATGAPRIIVYAARDSITRADVANLAEVDLVEAWIDPATGATTENVVRRNATTTAGVTTTCQSFNLNQIGKPRTFNAGSPSLYYARVLQVPTNRWSVYDCQASPSTNPTDCAAGGKLNVQVQERAWTSPIWYLP